MAETSRIVLEAASNQENGVENSFLLKLNVTIDTVKDGSGKLLPADKRHTSCGNSVNSLTKGAENMIPKKIKLYESKVCESVGNDGGVSPPTANSPVLVYEAGGFGGTSSLVPGPNFKDKSYNSEDEKFNTSEGSKYHISQMDIKKRELYFECKGHDKPDLSTSSSKDFAKDSSVNAIVSTEKSSTLNDVLLNSSINEFTTENPEKFEIGEYGSVKSIEPKSDIDSKDHQSFKNSDSNFEDEEFVGAVQYFSDPLSFQFLEDIGTFSPSKSVLARNSIYRNFDPLYEKFFQSNNVQDNVSEISKEAFRSDALEKHSDVDIESASGTVIDSSSVENGLPRVKTSPERIGNPLLSFETLMENCSGDRSSSETSGDVLFSKMYTNAELQHAITINELTAQEINLRNQRELEEKFKKCIQEKDEQIKELATICLSVQKYLEESLSEISNVKAFLSLKHLELKSEKIKLNELQIETEDLQLVKNAIDAYYKLYEQCNSLLKDKQDSFKQLAADSFYKQDQLCIMMQGKPEQVEKANADSLENVDEAQILISKPQ